MTFYVQWKLHPFAIPHVAEQKLENSKWALTQTKILLAKEIDSGKVKLAKRHNGQILIEILDPEIEEDGKEWWEIILNHLCKSEEIESISVLVNNDVSDKIASNLSDRVPLPWHQGYQGYKATTLIYHS